MTTSRLGFIFSEVGIIVDILTKFLNDFKNLKEYMVKIKNLRLQKWFRPIVIVDEVNRSKDFDVLLSK